MRGERLMIDKNSPVPIYFQLEELIKHSIEEGELNPGDLIPSEREYSEKFHISRMTVRQAISNLVNEGFLNRLRGKGTFVAERKIEQPLQGLTSFTEDMKARGMVPSSQLISFSIIPASLQISTQLGIQDHGPVYEIKRIRNADDVPMALETTYISANLAKGITEEIASQSLYEFIEKKAMLTIDRASQIIESATADSKEAKLLKIKTGTPVLLIQRNSFLENGTPFEVVKSVYRGDRYKFMINMRRSF